MKKFLVLMLIGVVVLLNAIGDKPDDFLNYNGALPGFEPVDPTYSFTTYDNENNDLVGVADDDMDVYLFNDDSIVPIEFNIFVDDTSITDVQLSIYAWDIDETSGEVDEVYLNGNYVGTLTGENREWSTSVFNVDPSYLVAGPNGKNLIQVYVDVENIGDPTWAVTVDWGQLVINNTPGNAYIRYVDLDDECYEAGEDVAITIEVDTDLCAQWILVETNLLDPDGVNIAGTSRYLFISMTNDEPFTETLTIPNGSPNGMYNVQVIVYGGCSYIQQDLWLVPFEVGCEVPVTLSSFTAVYENSTPTLQWTTQSESNNLGWNVYRSLSENIGQSNQINNILIPGYGTTSEPTNYVFTDENEVENNTSYWYWLESTSYSGETDLFGPVTLTIQIEENQTPDLPTESMLQGNYPNPFNPHTMISFSIQDGENGALTIYNTRGQLMETHHYEAGDHQLNWDAAQYGSGIYFYKLETQNYTNIKKMIMVK